MRHHLEISKVSVVALLFLFLFLLTLLTLDNSLTGQFTTIRTTVNVTGVQLANCSFTAYTGLNTISLPCTTTAEPIANVITSTTGFWAIYQYVPGASDLWRVYNPNLPGYVINDLNAFSRRIGYVAIMNSTRTIIFNGTIPLSTNIPIISGWQLVGYPSLNITEANTSFVSINDSFTEARTYNNSAGIYESYVNPGGGTLNYTVPGEGYWINGTQADTWVVFI